jgi:hypothetical protein
MDKAALIKQATWLGARLREPSTYVGLAGILVAFHIGNGEVDAATWAGLITTGGIFFGSLLAVILPEMGA